MNAVFSTLHNLHFDITAFCFEVAFFLLLHFALKEILYKPLLETKSKRNSAIEAHLAEAERLTSEARHSQTAYEIQRQQQRHDVLESQRKALEAAADAAQARVDEAHRQAAEILKAAKVEVAARKQRQEADLESQVEKVAKAIARRVIDTSVSPQFREAALKRWNEV